jgi:hypothetical protein
MKAIEAQNVSIEGLKDNFVSLEQSIKCCEHCQNKALMDLLAKNPAVMFGAWAQKNTKLAWTLTVVVLATFFVFLTLWLDPSIRAGAFMLLKFPQPWIDTLTH